MAKIPNFTSEEFRFSKAIAFGAAGVCFAVLLVLAQLPRPSDGRAFLFAACGFAVALPFYVGAGLMLHPINENEEYDRGIHHVLFSFGVIACAATGMGVVGVMALVDFYVMWIFVACGSVAALGTAYGRRRVTKRNPNQSSPTQAGTAGTFLSVDTAR